MHVIKPDGTPVSRYIAYRNLAWAMPAAWPCCRCCTCQACRKSATACINTWPRTGMMRDVKCPLRDPRIPTRVPATNKGHSIAIGRACRSIGSRSGSSLSVLRAQLRDLPRRHQHARLHRADRRVVRCHRAVQARAELLKWSLSVAIRSYSSLPCSRISSAFCVISSCRQPNSIAFSSAISVVGVATITRFFRQSSIRLPSSRPRRTETPRRAGTSRRTPGCLNCDQ